MNVRVLIPAAGAGRRMGAGTNKQYLELAGRPILARTLDLFEQHPLIDTIIIIVSPAEIAYCQAEIVARGDYRKVTAVVAGGAERQDSVYAGLQACEASEDDLILIHDGARPLISVELVNRVIESVQQHGACLTAVPVKDTVKVVQDGCVVDTPDRATLWLAQTPQAFRYGLIRSAYDRASEAGVRATDDSQLAEWAGYTVRVVQGDYRNLKITTPEDLSVAERLLAGGSEVGS
jgi:2-C-methyl-D-erythritol 4-phosphate cytidylyltransferase